MLARVDVVAVVTDVLSVGRGCFRPIFCLARWPPLHSVHDASDECHFFLTGPGCHFFLGSWDGGTSGVAGSRQLV
ncbi:hypothetical protein HanIR_Chr01g0035651 [Helianthus annuus]|nr:hypothetical protein HanIR_Chr01g0035651 [Helianthus annuus]